MLFWSAFAALFALTLCALLRPLLAKGQSVGGGTARDVFAAQLTELEADRSRGVISDADAATARTELARRILRAGDEAAVLSASRRRAWITATLVAVFVPVFGAGAYFALGAPELGDQPLAARIAPIDPQRLAALVADAEERLAANPDDGEGWAASAPAFQQLRRFDDAAAAYARADDL